MLKKVGEIGNAGPHIGVNLRLARETAGFSIEDVSEALHIQPRFIIAIEALNTTVLPSLGYALGYVRTYAQHLGLDHNEAVIRYKKDIACPANMGLREAPHHVPKRRLRLPKGSLAAVLIFAFVTLSASWYGWKLNNKPVALVSENTVISPDQTLMAPDPLPPDPDIISLKAVNPSWIRLVDEKGEVFGVKNTGAGRTGICSQQGCPHFIAT